MGSVPTLEKLALTALVPLGIIMLAVGMQLEGSDPDELVPAFKLKEKFGVAFGAAYAADPEKIRQACRMIGALKIAAVFNVWSRRRRALTRRGRRGHIPPGRRYFRNANVMCVLAGIAIPSFVLVAQTHMTLGEPQGSTMAALVFAVLMYRAAKQMKWGELDKAAAVAAVEEETAAQTAETPKPAATATTKKKKAA